MVRGVRVSAPASASTTLDVALTFSFVSCFLLFPWRSTIRVWKQLQTGNCTHTRLHAARTAAALCTFRARPHVCAAAAPRARSPADSQHIRCRCVLSRTSDWRGPAARRTPSLHPLENLCDGCARCDCVAIRRSGEERWQAMDEKRAGGGGRVRRGETVQRTRRRGGVRRDACAGQLVECGDARLGHVRSIRPRRQAAHQPPWLGYIYIYIYI